MLTALAVLAAACSSGSSGDEDAAIDRGAEAAAEEPGAPAADAAADEPEGEVPGAGVARPTVTGPVTGGTHDLPFNAMPAQLRERYDYVEEEYFLEGEATAYGAEGELGRDGRWTVTEAGTAPYRTRIVARRPADPDAFDGTVFVEWLNVTAGIDADPAFSFVHPELLRQGSAYVAVSSQEVSVEGGEARLPIDLPGVEIQALKEWDPERYGELDHPGDIYSYDIFSQAAQAVRRPGDVDVLDGLAARYVVAMGQSQSAARMVTYVNAVHPLAGIYDGFLIHSRGGGGAPLTNDPDIFGQSVAHIRDDLDEPVHQFLTESDLFGVLGFHEGRQDDSDTLRTWEVAGTAHADRAILDYNAEFAEEVGQGFDVAAECGSINDGPTAEVLRAGLAGLRAWVVDGTQPPEAPRLEVEGGAIARDERGIARGGIRTPAVDAPVSVLTGEAPPDRSVLCLLLGDTIPFDDATLAELYPTPQDYVDAVTESADAAVAAGFLLPPEADALIAAADEADIPR